MEAAAEWPWDSRAERCEDAATSHPCSASPQLSAAGGAQRSGCSAWFWEATRVHHQGFLRWLCCWHRSWMPQPPHSHVGAGRAAIEHNKWEDKRREWCQAAATPVLGRGAVLQRDAVGWHCDSPAVERKEGEKKDFSFLSAVQNSGRSTQRCRGTAAAISPILGRWERVGTPACARVINPFYT